MHRRQKTYEALIRISKEELEFQVRVILDRFDRTDRLIHLGVATLAGMIAVLGFLVTLDLSIGEAGGVFIGTSIMVIILAIYSLVRLNTSLHRGMLLDVGPNVRQFLDFIEKEDLDDEDYPSVMADLLPAHIESNTGMIQAMSARQGQAITMFLIGVILHLGGISFILGGYIHGLV